MDINEINDAVLKYMNINTKSSTDSVTRVKFFAEINIQEQDAVNAISLLHKKGFIFFTSHDISLTDEGRFFIKNSSFVEEQNAAKAEREGKWYNTENAEKVFTSYPKVENRSNWALGVSIAIAILELIRLIIGK